LLRAAAFAILLLGLAAAVRVDQASRRDQAALADQPTDMLAASPLAPGDSKRYGYQMGQISGDTGLLLDRAVRAGAWFCHGRPLAILMAVASFAAAGALLIAADRTPA
jgi:hypothetical protein